MQIFHKPEAVGAAHHIMRVVQPGWESGEPISEEADRILQALCLRPYIGYESLVAGGRTRNRPVRRYAEFVDDIDDVPTYELAKGKFS